MQITALLNSTATRFRHSSHLMTQPLLSFISRGKIPRAILDFFAILLMRSLTHISSLLRSRCGTSVRLQPSIQKLAATLKPQVEFARINVYSHPSVAQRFQLRAYPVFGVFTQRGVHIFWLTKKLSANSLFNMITRVGKSPDWVSPLFNP